MKKTISLGSRKAGALVLALALGPASVSMAADGIWTTKADMPTARFVPSSSVVDGKIYVIGGTPDGHICFPTVEEYDPTTDTWTRKGNMPMVRGAAASSVVNGKVYVIGGGSSLYGEIYSPVIEYDTKADTWTAKANIPTARSWASSSVVDGKIYAIGGAQTYKGAPFSTVEEYDPATDTWTRKADMPTARTCVSTSTVNGKIYVIGGSPGYGQWYQGLSKVEEYDPVTDTWTKKADMTTPRTYLSTCAVNGRIYVIGGLTTGSNHLSPVEVYDPATDTWTRKADMPTARSGLSTCTVNGKMYAIGGWAGSNYAGISTVEEYEPNPFVVDFNSDGIVDLQDLLKLINSWGQDDRLVDIAPPFGDGVVDALDLEVLMSHWGHEVDDPTLIACWKLDKTEGDVAYDSGTTNDAVVLGSALWQPDAGMVNGALQFDGIDDYVNTPFILNPADGMFSVFVWVKGVAPGQVIMSQEHGTNWLLTDAQGCFMTALESNGRRPGGPLISETTITDGNWHRVGFTWDGTNRILYVDDAEVAHDTLTSLNGSEGGLYIGTGKGFEAGTFWSGLIDDVRVYDRVVKP